MGTTHAAINVHMTTRQIIFSRRVIVEISTCKRDDGRNVYNKKIIAAQNARPAKKYFSCIKSSSRKITAEFLRSDFEIYSATCSGAVVGSFLIVSEGVVTRRCVPA